VPGESVFVSDNFARITPSDNEGYRRHSGFFGLVRRHFFIPDRCQSTNKVLMLGYPNWLSESSAMVVALAAHSCETTKKQNWRPASDRSGAGAAPNSELLDEWPIKGNDLM
jgi:hypothetical protein